MELCCSRDLALVLGAVDAKTFAEHRALATSGQNLLVRDRVTCLPLFWPWTMSRLERMAETGRSS